MKLFIQHIYAKHRMTLRRMDGSLAGNLKAILSHYNQRMGMSRRTKRLKKTKESNSQPFVTNPASAKCPCSITHAHNQSAFVLDEMLMQAAKTHFIFFRIRPGCKEPRNADGRMAWTTLSVDMRRETCQIRVTYRPKDSVHAREEYVPLSSLDLCVPNLKEDEALVIDGPDKGKVVYPSHSDKKATGGRAGIYCKHKKEDRKKDAIMYALENVTRVRKMDAGQPE